MLNRLNAKATQIMVVGARGIPNVEGGAEKNAEALFPRVVAAGYTVDLMGLSTYLKNAEFSGVRLHPAPHYNILKTDKIFYYLYALRKAFISRPDIVHLQGLGAAIFLLLYKSMGFKVVVRYGSADYTVGKWGILGKLGFRFCEWQLRFADAVISVTPALSKRLAERGIVSNVYMIPNALDETTLHRPFSAKKQFILAVGRVTAQKNVLVLIKAFKKFNETHPDYELHIAGGLDDLQYCEEVKCSLEPNIKLLGKIPRSEIPHLLNSASFFVNISLHEGSSNASLEAISHDIPIILSDIPENRDINLADKFYVDPNAVESIVDKFLEVAASPKDFVASKEKFHSWAQVADETLQIYGKVLNRNAVEAYT